MKYWELVDKINEELFPCAFEAFPSPPPVPYCVVAYAYNRDVMADGRNFLAVGKYQVELYTEKRHPPDEEKLESFLQNLGFAYRKSGFFNGEIELYQVVYEIELIGG